MLLYMGVRNYFGQLEDNERAALSILSLAFIVRRARVSALTTGEDVWTEQIEPWLRIFLPVHVNSGGAKAGHTTSISVCTPEPVCADHQSPTTRHTRCNMHTRATTTVWHSVAAPGVCSASKLQNKFTGIFNTVIFVLSREFSKITLLTLARLSSPARVYFGQRRAISSAPCYLTCPDMELSRGSDRSLNIKPCSK
jgi:hypothetical protein